VLGLQAAADAMGADPAVRAQPPGERDVVVPAVFMELGPAGQPELAAQPLAQHRRRQHAAAQRLGEVELGLGVILQQGQWGAGWRARSPFSTGDTRIGPPGRFMSIMQTTRAR
jgi:hypothetical protein